MTRWGPAVAAAAVTLMTLAGCSGSSPEPAPSPSPSVSTSAPETPGPVGYIEVSVSIGGGTDAELVSLAADLAGDEADGATSTGPDAPAWCTGAVEREDADVEPLDGYVVRLAPSAVTVADGGATAFELRADGPVEAGVAVAAEFVLEVGAERYSVTDGRLTVAEVIDAGTFSGTAADGIVLEGAFLCG